MTQLCDYRLEIDAEKFRSVCYFPGVTYDDFDRAGNVAPWKICRMFEAGRAVSFRQGNFFDFLDLIKDRNSTYFVLGGNYYFEPCLWEIGRQHRYFPYKITSELVNFGKTSFTIRNSLVNLIDNKQLAYCDCIFVYIDKTSRRPQLFPPGHRLKYQSVQSSDVTIDAPTASVPGTAYTRQLSVAASDTDVNGHTNQATYIRYCLDTAEQARREKGLRNFSKDVCLYPIAKIGILYKGETLSGDMLRGSVWENDLEPNKLHFVISRGNDIAFTATIEFRIRPSAQL